MVKKGTNREKLANKIDKLVLQWMKMTLKGRYRGLKSANMIKTCYSVTTPMISGWEDSESPF